MAPNFQFEWLDHHPNNVVDMDETDNNLEAALNKKVLALTWNEFIN